MKKSHQIKLAAHPEAAPILAALYTACEGGGKAIEGKVGGANREKLAAIVGGSAAEVLRGGKAIRIRPKDAVTWLVLDESGDPYADYALARAIREEMERQGISSGKMAGQCGASQRTVYNVISAQGSPAWWVVKAIVAALGKDLRWLAGKVG